MRTRFLAAALGVGLAATQLGCQACQSCYDYSSPVSGAVCGAAGQCRAGAPAMMAGVADASPVEATVAERTPAEPTTAR